MKKSIAIEKAEILHAKLNELRHGLTNARQFQARDRVHRCELMAKDLLESLKSKTPRKMMQVGVGD